MSSTPLEHQVAEIRRQQEILAARLDQEQQALSHLAKRLWAQQESEKAKLSRELHDGVGQLLTGLTRRLQSVSNQQPELAELAQIAEMALADIRQLSRLMSPTILDDLGLKPALKWLCRSLFEPEAGTYETHFDVDVELAKDVSILIFRVAQESLVNSIKYAKASHTRVLLSVHHRTARLDIIDNGIGFNYDDIEQGVGLKSMQDRARAFDADFEVHSKPQAGTRVSLTVGL